jgi:hypothetical protein
MNVDNSKPVPKSLHTVTAIVNVAKFHMGVGMLPVVALDVAMTILGLSGRDDPHGLAEQALKQLKVMR